MRNFIDAIKADIAIQKAREDIKKHRYRPSIRSTVFLAMIKLGFTYDEARKISSREPIRLPLGATLNGEALNILTSLEEPNAH